MLLAALGRDLRASCGRRQRVMERSEAAVYSRVPHWHGNLCTLCLFMIWPVATIAFQRALGGDHRFCSLLATRWCTASTFCSSGYGLS